MSLALFLAFSVEVMGQHEHEGHNMESKTMNSEEMANSRTEVFAVYGNCGMCENRIENAVVDLDGVYSADWDADSKDMTVKFDKKAIKLKKIQETIAAVGHDTGKYRAADDVYANLPGCCQYDRPDE